jgi:transcriptional regulator GlxA family with amidase domain
MPFFTQIMEKTALKISIVALPDATLSTVTGMYDVFSMFDSVVSGSDIFDVEIVTPAHHLVSTASGLPLTAHRTIKQVSHSDIVILPSFLLANSKWQTGRYPQLVDWLKRMYEQGATLCSACTGVLVLAETGFLDGGEATLHWAYERTFKENFPNIRLRLESVLIVGGPDQRLVMSGASASWHDLALYLVARYAGLSAAQSIAKFFLFQWHSDGQAPYIVFREEIEHSDAVILKAQQWMRENLVCDNPIEEVMRQSGLPERSFKRRFRKATGHTPIVYMQNLRVEEAKRQLEIGNNAVDDISYSVGYEESAFFRRLFKRTTGLTPGAYRKKFRVPLLAGIRPA